MSIVNVEAGLQGLQEGGRPTIRFEAHVFNAQLKKHGIQEAHGKWGASTLVGRNVDGVSCEGGQGAEQACFAKALSINKEAAYESISMGLGQIMGFNSSLVGFSSAEDMYNHFSAGGGGEPEQIRAMFKLIERVPAQLKAARNKDFGAFAQAYNGAKVGTAKNEQYTAALRKSYLINGGEYKDGRPTPGGPSAVA